MLMSLALYGQQFQATFESNSLTAEIGEYSNSGLLTSLDVVSNPLVDSVNSSNYVLEVTLLYKDGDGSSTRYGTDELDCAEKVLAYTWKSYYTSGLYDGCSFDPGYLMNFKRSPDVAAVFQLLDTSDPTISYWNVLADGDTLSYTENLTFGAWVEYVLEVFYTQTDTGYYRLYKNNELIFELYDVQTMTDDDALTGADFLVGSYSVWENTNEEDIVYYFDDMYAYDITDSDLYTLWPDLDHVKLAYATTAAEIEAYSAEDYDTIYVSNDITEDIQISNSGTADKPIHIHAESQYTFSGNITVTGSYVEIENFIITGDLIKD
jgi:hypothetical protein